jgi:hypothetical protein
MTTATRVEHDSMGTLEVSSEQRASGRPRRDRVSCLAAGQQAYMTDLSMDDPKRLLDPLALTEGGIQGAGSFG